MDKNEYLSEKQLEYEPDVKDTFISNKSGDYQRLIWGEPQELKEREIERWEGFMEYIEENKLDPLPDYYMNEETKMGYRFL